MSYNFHYRNRTERRFSVTGRQARKQRKINSRLLRSTNRKLHTLLTVTAAADFH